MSACPQDDSSGALPFRKPLRVVAGIIRRNGLILIARRRQGDALGGYWEFPGGRVEPREAYRVALARELREELGITAQVGDLYHTSLNSFRDRLLQIRFYECTIVQGEPQPLEADELRWVTPADLLHFKFPPADQSLIELLARPRDRAP